MINILMSTYNGEHYLPTQLDSIINQSLTDWQLFIRDDGSTDQTPDIVARYAATDSRIHILQDGEIRQGAMHSFEYLLCSCPNADYYAFADQDDMWLPDKLQVSLNSIKQAEKHFGIDYPIVVHTDLQVVDQNLNTISPSFWTFSNLHPQLIESDIHYLAIANCLTGCTLLFNHKARQAALPFNSQAYMHDAWLGLATMLNDGYLVPIDQPTMLYRQHANNTLGAVEYRFTFLQWKWKIFLAKRSYQAAKGLVFRNIFHFIYWKIRYFIALHIS